MRFKFLSIATAILFSISFLSCTQEEGFGGGSLIKGKLITKYYNEDFTVFQGEEPAVDEEISLLLGNDNAIAKDVETSFNGEFKFEYLWPGNYKIFYASDDTTKMAHGTKTIVKEIVLEKNQTYDMGTVYNYKALRWNRGTAKIMGKVIVTNYKNSSSYPNLVIKDITPAQEQEIYITYNNEDFYSDRIRTQGDGTYVFPNLLLGKYTIFVYSDDVITGSTEMIVKKAEIEVTQKGQVIVLDDLHIEKH
jgi:hypothetical protein